MMKLIAGGATADVFLDNEDRIIKLFKRQYSENVVQILIQYFPLYSDRSFHSCD
jgi:hypothetical protein